MRNAATLKLNVNQVAIDEQQHPPPLEEFYKRIPEDFFVKAEPHNRSNGTSDKESAAAPVKPSKATSCGDKAQEDKAESKSISTSANSSDTAKQRSGDMVQEENAINDGADEQMLGVEDNDKLAEKREEVKFIKGGDQQNGDAKIDIGTGLNGKSFTGMTKEELMKYANDPFWVRLRWICFIAFWAIWVAMLVGAILIIIGAPKCAAPEPLPWYKRGVLAKFKAFEAGADDVAAAKRVQASGVIYELPATLTYSVREPAVEEKVKQIVAQYKDSDARVILDITPNYVTRDSSLMKNALADASKRSAFIWIEGPKVPNNWLSIVNGSAWAELQPKSYVLSQFDDGLYDLHMNDTIVKQAFDDVLRHLLSLGVRGFRLKNTKFYLLSKDIKDEVPSGKNFIHDEYGFWTHTQTTFQEGLGDLLYEFMLTVKNVSADAFLSVTEDIVRPETYRTKSGQFGIDMPMYGRLTRSLSASDGKRLQSELQDLQLAVGNDSYLQWNFEDVQPELDEPTATAMALFLSLLPGVPVVPMAASSAFSAVPASIYEHIEQLRLSPSFMHGDFELYNAANLVAYSRIKSGNPGYFVVFNPLDVSSVGNFSGPSLPEKMSVDALSANYNVTKITVKSKVETKALEVSPHAAIILTYVPVKSG